MPGRRGTNYFSNVATQITLRTGQSVIGRPLIGRVLHEPLFNINAPIRDAQGKVIGALFGVINLSKPNFLDRVGEHGYGKSGGYLVIDPKLRLIVTATDKSRVLQPLPAVGVNETIDRRAMGSLRPVIAVNSLGIEMLSSVSPIALPNWLVVAALPTAEAFAPIHDMQRRIMWACVMLSLLAGMLSWWLLRHQFAPLLSAVKELAAQSDSDCLPRPLAITRPDEIGELISGFNRLLARLGQREEAMKDNEQALQIAKTEAERANQSKSRFLAAASHDLRQPLAALTLYVGVLKNQVTPEGRGLVAKIQNCCDGLSELLTDLLDVSKLDAGVVKPNISDFSVNDFLSALVAMHSAEAALKGVQLRLHGCAAVVARTDRQLLTRIVANLIDNAIGYTSQGGVLLACRYRAGKQWIEVWDTGVGIPADKTQYIFEEFRQLDHASSGKGSGLGLAIVAKTAELLGLQICLRSRPGRGSMFAIEVPLGRAIKTAESAIPPVVVGRTRIGVVEDNPQVLHALVQALESAGHDVVAATNAKELLARLQQQAPDIVVSDYRLQHGETGFDVIKAARAAFGEALLALIITGDTDPELVRSMAKRGIAIQYKPLRFDALQAFVSHAIEGRSS